MSETADVDIRRVSGSGRLSALTADLLARLPEWFGLPDADAGYVAAAGRLPGYVAGLDGTEAAVLLYRRHFPEATEIHLMAVTPQWHRRGIGRGLVAALVAELTADGCRTLLVKTLGPSHPDAGYARTRAFYRAVGFHPLEEITGIRPGQPCLLMVRSLP